MANMNASSKHVILFGRYPVPGKVKTRLIPALGPFGAAALHKQLAEKCLSACTHAMKDATVWFSYCGASKQRVRRWLGKRPVRLQRQTGQTLGERMQNAINACLKEGAARTVLVGTDIPRFASADLTAAFEALTDHDVVIGPSSDGGYWLIGMKSPADLFRNIAWGTPAVLDQTLAAANHLGLSVALIRQHDDLDTPDDLARWQPETDWARPWLSVVIPALNEADNIAETIASAKLPDGEIIVVDGGSSDATAARATAEGAKVLACAPGRARQQNVGSQAARGDVLLFLHADTRLPVGYGHHVFDTLMDAGVAAGAFRFTTDHRHPGMKIIDWSVQVRSTLLQMPYGDQALFVAADRFHRVGGYPEVAIAEDLMLVRRLNRMGRIRIVPRYVVTSGRRWARIGLLRTTLINAIITAGCMAGIEPIRLAPLYKRWTKRER